MARISLVPCGEFKTSYAADTTLFTTPLSRNMVILGVVLLALAPLSIGGVEPVSDYWITLLIQIGYLGIAALGLNILVGFTGQISLGHAAFFGFGAFASAWLNNSFGIPVALSIPLAGVMTTAVGMVVGIPAARIKGLYLAIATLASQFILQDFFARADWFTGGSSGASAGSGRMAFPKLRRTGAPRPCSPVRPRREFGMADPAPPASRSWCSSSPVPSAWPT